MFFMIERFMIIKDQVHIVLISLGKGALFPDEEELTMLEDITEALKWVERSSRKLCQHDISIADADRVYTLCHNNF